MVILKSVIKDPLLIIESFTENHRDFFSDQSGYLATLFLAVKAHVETFFKQRFSKTS